MTTKNTKNTENNDKRMEFVLLLAQRDGSD